MLYSFLVGLQYVSTNNEQEASILLGAVNQHFSVDTELHQGFQIGSLVVEPDLGVIIRNG